MAQPGCHDSVLSHLFAPMLEIHVVSATKTRIAEGRKYFVGWIQTKLVSGKEHLEKLQDGLEMVSSLDDIR